MRPLVAIPLVSLLQGCASIGVGAFIVTPILFVVFVIACIWALVRLISGSSKHDLERAKFEHQKEMDRRAAELLKHTPRAYVPTLPTPQPAITSKAKQTQECPYCKEEILVGAVICKHCRSSL